MTTTPNHTMCPICGGRKEPGTTTYSVDLGTGVVVVRNVKAQICVQCGEEWLDDKTAEMLEGIVADARKNQRQFEVLAL